MRARFLTWFLFVSCTQAISKSANYGSIKETMRLDKKDEEKQGLLFASIKKAHGGGRGPGGGTNVDRRPRHPENSAPPLLSWSSTMCVCLTLVLMSFFHIELL